MRAWHFTEMPYPHYPPDEPATRINLPNKHFDPQIGAALYNRYLDEHMIPSSSSGFSLLTPDFYSQRSPRHPRR